MYSCTTRVEKGGLAVLRNLTPHEVNIYRDGDIVLSLPPESGCCPRVADDVLYPTLEYDNIRHNGVDVPLAYVSPTKRVTGLPDAVPGVTLIVSRLVAEACPDRLDLVFPYKEVRNSAGDVIGCERLAELVTACEPEGPDA